MAELLGKNYPSFIPEWEKEIENIQDAYERRRDTAKRRYDIDMEPFNLKY